MNFKLILYFDVNKEEIILVRTRDLTRESRDTDKCLREFNAITVITFMSNRHAFLIMEIHDDFF